MKKLLLAVIGIVFGLSVAEARDQIVRDTETLPSAAREFLSKNFKSPVSFIKLDKTLGYVKDYEVVLTDGTEIDFDNSGNWESVESPSDKPVPSAIMPKTLTDYVKRVFKGQRIISVEKKRNKYEVELSGGLDLEFDRAGNFKKLDD